MDIQSDSSELRPGQKLWLSVKCDLELGDMTLGQGHDTPLGWGQQSCEILPKSNVAVRRHGPYKNLSYVHTVPLTLAQGHDKPKVNSRVKYFPDQT